jgi:hypothetical protein
VRPEAIARFVIFSGLVDQVTDLVVLALPKPAYPTMIPIPVPKLRVDMARLV